jgi:mercuric ion binding protein
MNRMKLLSSLLFSLTLVCSCNQKDDVVVLKRQKLSETQKEPKPKKETPNTVLELDIEGMTCELGCGGSIRMGVKELGGIHRVRFDFKEGQKKQRAFVSYDSKKVDKNQIIKEIEKLNDGQFIAEEISKEKSTTNS